MSHPAELVSICESCGRPFLNFCVQCAKAHREEVVEALMDKYNLGVEELVVALAQEVTKENFGALRLAIEMRSMKPAAKTDVTSGGQPIFADQNAKNRLVDKIARVLASREEG